MRVTKFWRLSPSTGATSVSDATAILTRPSELLRKLSVGDGIVVAAWDHGEVVGRASAIGLVREVSTSQAEIEWKSLTFQLEPNPAGRVHWATKQFFGFADSVVARYGLRELFGRHFQS